MLSHNADITVMIIIGLDSTIRSSDSDPKFFISDGERGVGFEMREDSPWCQGMQGLMSDSITGVSRLGDAAVQSSILPEEFIILLSVHLNSGDHATMLVTMA